ncbi:MAG: hypothetical protein ABH883_06840 [Candidatus Omnitrophota bacterium]
MNQSMELLAFTSEVCTSAQQIFCLRVKPSKAEEEYLRYKTQDMNYLDILCSVKGDKHNIIG